MIKIFRNLICLAIFFAIPNIFAITTIEITEGNIDPIPIAINEFSGHNHADVKSAENIVKVIKNDLHNCGVFRPISNAAFIENKIGVSHKPLFAAWQQINANLLVNGEVQRLDSGKLKVKFILWDTILETQLVSETLEFSETIWRRGAHRQSHRADHHARTGRVDDGDHGCRAIWLCLCRANRHDEADGRN